MTKSRPGRWAWPLVFLFPALVIFLLFMVVPIAMSFFYSLTQWSGLGDPKVIGFGNFVALTTDEVFLDSIVHSLELTFWALVVQLPLGIVLALVLLSPGLRWKKLFQTFFFLPVIISTVVIGVLWTNIYAPEYGLIDSVIRLLNLDVHHVWLGEMDTSLAAIVVVVCWQFIGFYMVVFYAGLQSVPTDVIESAKIDGASNLGILFKIRLPLISHVVAFCVINCVVNSLKYFDLIYVLTEGGPGNSSEVMASWMFKQAFKFTDFGYSSAISTFLFVFGMGMAFALNKALNQEPVQY